MAKEKEEREISEEQYLALQEAQIREEQREREYIQHAPAMFSSQSKQNLVEWQLDFRTELEDIERLLRSDVILMDKKTGQSYWGRNPDKASVFLNSKGVNDLIRTIRMFLNKNKVLSNYGKDEIAPRVLMLGNELRALIFNNYEAYEIDKE